MSRPVRIITDPAELRRISQNQPRVSLEEMRRSVQAGVKMVRRDAKGNTGNVSKPVV